MSRHILVAIDTNLSPATQEAMRAVSELIEQAALPVPLLLLNVIPITQIVTVHPNYAIDQIVPILPSADQRDAAIETLLKARLLLQQQGVALEHTEGIIRVGSPPDEIAKAAKEFRAYLIVIGSHGNAFKHRMRRLFLGSISRQVLQLAPCPVMIVVPPQLQQDSDLASWYEQAIKNHLKVHNHKLSVFTAQLVVQQFPVAIKKPAQRQEIVAARLALERLAQTGVLYRHDVDGDTRYLND